ncbi:MAG: AAA family ATPase, partial [Deltaproteobacteria bacterium]|nr:AAA family ATPase [Deltaproteobacteria bacterium]
MLIELSVKNFALIESLNLSLAEGFNVITGETGAGKSIIVGALNLIIGGRASTDLIRQGAEEAEVQALFSLDQPIAHRLETLGLPVEEDLIIRRVLTK